VFDWTWWCVKPLASAGLPPLLLATAMSFFLRWSLPRGGSNVARSNLAIAAGATIIYLAACVWWWTYVYPGGNETGAWTWYYHNRLRRAGAAIGAAWGLYHLVTTAPWPRPARRALAEPASEQDGRKTGKGTSMNPSA
jgi:hypothetical protein